MWITSVSIKNPVFATMVMTGLCVMGVFAYNRLGVEQLPDVTLPVLSVSVSYPGASPAAVENDLTKPIENAVNTVAGIKTIRSSSYEGDSETSIEFRNGTDVNRVTQEVRDRIAEIRASFPREAKEPLVLRADAENQQPVVSLSVVSSSRGIRDLTTLTDQVIIKELEKSPGVGRVVYSGGAARQILIHVRPQDLAANGIGIDQVMDAIKNANQDIAAGRISNSATESLVRVEGRVKDISSFGRIIVARRGAAGDTPVYLDQLADIVDGQEEAQTIGRLNGNPAISISIFKVQDANIVEVGEGVADVLEHLKTRLPPGVEIKTINSTSAFVKDSLTGLKHTLLEGALLTVLIVFLFLRSWRSTIITGLTLPISVISTFIAVYACGFTLNFMTMMALSLCIGLLIDDAIVVRENIVRHLRMGKTHRQAAEDGTNEIGLAVMATTFAIVAVFVPVAFMSGVIGKFFFSFGITVTVAVLISLFVSFTLDPMLSSVWYDPTHSRLLRIKPLRAVLDGFEHLVERTHRTYGRLLEWTFSDRKYLFGFLGPKGITLWGAFLSFVLALVLVGSGVIGSEFIPEVDEGWISLKLTTPVGASLQYADEKTRQVEAELKDIPEIEAVDVNVFGDQRGTVRVNLKLVDLAKRSRSQKQLQELIRKRLSHIAGAQLSIGFDTPIYIAVLGPDIEKLNEITAKVAAQVGKVRGIVDLDTSNKPGTPALAIRPNSDVASDVGLNVNAIGNVLRPLVEGQTVTYWLGPDGQNYEVRVQLPRTNRSLASDIGDLMISTSKLTADGATKLVPLRSVATIVPSESPQVIKRQDLQRRVAIFANVDGRPSGDVGTDIAAIVKAEKQNIPPGYRIFVGGAQQDQDESSAAAAGALFLAVIFIYLILASQFGSFLQPVAIMASLPFSLIGVLLALLLTHTTLNIFSIIGFIMLMGLVTKNAILLVDFANQGQRSGLTQRDALLAAGQVRLRPIMMTTAAMIFGMLPLALGLGQGSEQQAPMGRAIIGGVITSTLLTLWVVPVIYTYLDRWGRAVSAFNAARVARRAAEDGHLAPAEEAQPAPQAAQEPSALPHHPEAPATGR